MPYLTLVDSTAERDFTQHAEVRERNGRVGRGMSVVKFPRIKLCSTMTCFIRHLFHITALLIRIIYLKKKISLGCV